LFGIQETRFSEIIDQLSETKKEYRLKMHLTDSSDIAQCL